MPESLLLITNILKRAHGQTVRPTHDRSGKEKNVSISQHDKEENPVWRAAGVLHDRQLSKDREGDGDVIQDRPHQAPHQTTQDSRVYAPAGTAGGAE